MGGVKVRESDVILAMVAAKQKGWVREHFNPFLGHLEDKGYEIDSSVLIRGLASIGTGGARLKMISEKFWAGGKDFKKA